MSASASWLRRKEAPIMNLRLLDHNNIRVEDASKSDIHFVIVDGVFFQRIEESFNAITNNNLNGYQVEIAPVDSLDMVLSITASRATEEITVIVEDRIYQHGQIRFIPSVR